MRSASLSHARTVTIETAFREPAHSRTWRESDINVNQAPLANVEVSAKSDPLLQAPLRLIAENAHKLFFLALQDIDYIESCGDYVLIHIGEQKFIRRDTLRRLSAALRNRGFERIKRSVLVNISRVSYAEKLTHGALAFTLASGTRLVSRSRVKLECARMERE
jgi:DNA-binding LytR/AlgR family response regulator